MEPADDESVGGEDGVDDGGGTTGQDGATPTGETPAVDATATSEP